mmetsp:Transcript_105141/g.297126  ORF Transcript_105141/g.297126 Transcript_105141/m.297126 type:complete len:238 (+) Transcript_105141:397-1110(+)
MRHPAGPEFALRSPRDERPLGLAARVLLPPHRPAALPRGSDRGLPPSHGRGALGHARAPRGAGAALERAPLRAAAAAALRRLLGLVRPLHGPLRGVRARRPRLAGRARGRGPGGRRGQLHHVPHSRALQHRLDDLGLRPAGPGPAPGRPRGARGRERALRGAQRDHVRRVVQALRPRERGGDAGDGHEGFPLHLGDLPDEVHVRRRVARADAPILLGLLRQLRVLVRQRADNRGAGL